MKLEGLSILGQRRAAATGKPKAAINPATGEAIGPDYYWATLANVDEASNLAMNAFVKFRVWPAKQRQAFLNRIAELLEANAAEIVARGNLETALPAARLHLGPGLLGLGRVRLLLGPRHLGAAT